MTNNNTLAKEISSLYSQTHDIPLKNLLGRKGNNKIPASIAIFNMGSATDCPSKKLGLCAASCSGVKCYAKKAENMYPKSLPYRRRQEKFWKSVSAEQFALQFLMINEAKRNPFIALRINESGDFWGQEDVEKVEKIARILKRHGITCYGYTSRKDLNFKNIRDFVISGSGFKKEGIKNIFQIIHNKKDRIKGFGICAGDCSVCNRCRKSGLKTCVLSH